jgi:hypothetical protein
MKERVGHKVQTYLMIQKIIIGVEARCKKPYSSAPDEEEEAGWMGGPILKLLNF